MFFPRKPFFVSYNDPAHARATATTVLAQQREQRFASWPPYPRRFFAKLDRPTSRHIATHSDPPGAQHSAQFFTATQSFTTIPCSRNSASDASRFALKTARLKGFSFEASKPTYWKYSRVYGGWLSVR